MDVKILEEHGYNAALRGLSYSFKDRSIDPIVWWTTERIAKIEKTALALSKRDGGHNKFLESITVYLDMEAPRFFWSEFDTYRAGVTKQSESTMHTISKRPLNQRDFDNPVPDNHLEFLNGIRQSVSVEILKGHLPESYLQRRVVVLNYKVLRGMILQRHDHRLPHWKEFIEEVLSQVEHPELLPTPYE